MAAEESTYKDKSDSRNSVPVKRSASSARSTAAVMLEVVGRVGKVVGVGAREGGMLRIGSDELCMLLS